MRVHGWAAALALASVSTMISAQSPANTIDSHVAAAKAAAGIAISTKRPTMPPLPNVDDQIHTITGGAI